MRNPDQVRIVIEGQEITVTTSATIQMAIDQIADGFSVVLPFDPDDAIQRKTFRPFGYQRVQLYIGDDIVLDGYVDKVTPGSSAEGRIVTIEGRSKTGQLCDCSIDGDLENSGLTLAAAARKYAGTLGVSIRADNDSPAIPETRASFGDKAGDYLNSLAAPRNLLLNSSFDGRLVISSGLDFLTRTPVADLEEGKPPLLSVQTSFDSTARFSTYKVATQFAGVEDISGSVTDPTVPLKRPILAAAGEMDANPGNTAARLRAEAIARALTIQISLAGWRRPDGKRWAERQVVRLKAPGAMLYDFHPWLIDKLTLTMEKTNLTSSMTLVPRELFSNNAPKEPKWA